MEDFDELRHQNQEHQNVAWVNWNLGDPTDGGWTRPTKEQVIAFANRLVSHYMVYLGKTLYVELTSPALETDPYLMPIIQTLHEQNARVGLYAPHKLSGEFWTKVKPYVDQTCMVYAFGDDIQEFIDTVNSASDRIDIHVNMTFLNDEFDVCLRSAKTLAKNTSEITINLFSEPGQETVLDEEKQQRLVGANAQIKRIAANNRSRPRKAHRGSMIMVSGDTKTEITPRDIQRTGMNQYEGWTCMAGVEQIIITSYGDVVRGWCRVGGKIGRITDPIISFPIKGLTCTKETCNSVVDIACTKSWF